MKVTPLPFDPSKLPAFAPERAAARSAGIHLSEIIAYIMVRGGYSQAYRPGKWDASGMLKAQLGFLWEDVLQDALKVLLANGTPMKQLEIKHADIYMTIDCLVLDATPPRIEEYKLSKRSLRKFKTGMAEHFLAWLLQIAGYCVGASAVYGVKIRHARLVPIFLNGDYTWKPPHGDTTAYPVELEFSDSEIEEYWGMILQNRDALAREREAGTWPPKEARV